MMKILKKQTLKMGAAMVTGAMMTSMPAYASNNFSKIAGNMNESMSLLPGLLAALAYMFGILLAALGIMKIKDHVENPSQTPLKDGAIRLAAGGALFALPIISEAMLSTIDKDNSGAAASSAELYKMDMDTK